METQTAIQDLIPNNHCFGCGPSNPDGLQIKSYWQPDGSSVCHFTPLPHHSAGPVTYLNGGIIATLIDCHCICTAIADGYREQGVADGHASAIWCVTGELQIRYHAPAPIKNQVKLVARINGHKGKKRTLHCELFSLQNNEPTLCATASVIAIQVPPDWAHSG